jgi:hypothetical protein
LQKQQKKQKKINKSNLEITKSTQFPSQQSPSGPNPTQT